MRQIHPPPLADRSAASRQLLGEAEAILGKVPALLEVLAHSDHALEAYLTLQGACAQLQLPAQEREAIGLRVARLADSAYALSMHVSGAQRSNLDAIDIETLTRQQLPEGADYPLPEFAEQLLTRLGAIDAADFAHYRARGLTDREMVETTVTVVAALFTCLISNLAGLEGSFSD